MTQCPAIQKMYGYIANAISNGNNNSMSDNLFN